MFSDIDVIDKIIKKFDIAVCETDKKNDSFTFFLALSALCITFTFLSHFYIALTDCNNKISV